MGNSRLCLALVAALLLFAVRSASAAAAPETVSGAWTSRWFVELESPPVADGTSPSELTAERGRFRAAARAEGVAYKERFAFSTLFNGISISLRDEAVPQVRNLDGVVAMHPVDTVTLDQAPNAFEPDLAFAISMTGADIARSTLGYSGRGVHVAIMDSGVDYDHPDLGGCFGRGCRVTKGYDFVGDDYNEDETDPRWQPVPHPDALPDDCGGHGTHVAGIVGARGAITGVAPDITLGSYRVFGCSGATSSDVMIAAMERIYRDGADVLNMSISENLSSWPEAPTAQAATRLAKKGVVVVAGAGNDRLDGLWAAGAPGVGKDVIAVGSVDNLKRQTPAFALSPDQLPIAYAPGTGTVALPTAGTFEIARIAPDDGCNPIVLGSLAGKVALIRRNDLCTFRVKAANAADAGAVGVIFYNNAGPIDGQPLVTGTTIPVVYIAQQDGELINGRLDQGPVTMTWGATASAPSPSAGLLSVFSSTGLAADLSLKPDIVAPGGLIRSTWPVEKGGQAVVSGTSMASPHVAGAVALLLQARPRLRSEDVAAVLQNSADPVPWANAPGLGFLDYVARQGAGLLDIDDAILATTAVTPGKLSVGDSVTRRGRDHTLTIANNGRQTLTYALSSVDALAVAGRDITTEHPELGAATVAFTRHGRPVTSVTVRPNARVEFDVAITPSAALSEGAIYGGYVVLIPDLGDQPLRVPFAGYKGDYQAIEATTPTTMSFPWLARATGIAQDAAGRIRPVYAKLPAGEVFSFAPKTLHTEPAGPITRTGTDAPVVLVHMNHHARRIRIEAFDARSGRSRGEVFAQDFVARNRVENVLAQPSDLATVLALDGTSRFGHRRFRLPDGEYYVVMTVEKALAERGTPTETWRSPTFRIDRR